MRDVKARLDRRQFLGAAGAAAAGFALGGEAQAQEARPAVLGSGRWTYTQVEGWGAPPEGMTFKMGCAVVVDSKDQVYVHSQADKMVVVYDKSGKVVRDFGTDFTGTGGAINRPSCHGLYLQRSGSDEFLYFSVLNPYHQVIKTDLNGKVLLRLGKVASESPTSIAAPFNNPTDVAVAPNDDIYVCEGYGGNVVRRFDANGKALGVIGTPGAGPGQFKTCHGIWVDTRRGKEPELYVADRNNSRLQIFSLDGQLKREVKEGMRKPCCFYQHRGVLLIPDLDKVVTVLNREDQVVAHLGDGKSAEATPAAFQAPHALTVDSEGSLYVVEWVADARLRKFKHTPAA